MKKQSVNNIARKLFFGSILSAAIIFSAQSKVFAAGDEFKSDSALSVNKLENVFVKYDGSTEGGLFFNVKYNNDKGQIFDILITDENGDLLYEGSFSDKVFDKKFLLPEDSKTSLISISVKSGKDNYIKSFSVKSNSAQNIAVK